MGRSRQSQQRFSVFITYAVVSYLLRNFPCPLAKLMDPALFWSSWTLFPADVVVLSAVVVASCSEKKQMRIDLLQMPSTQFFSYSKSRYCKMLSKPQEGSKGFQKVCYFRTRSARHSASDYYCSRSRSDLINFELSILSCVVAQLNNSRQR